MYISNEDCEYLESLIDKLSDDAVHDFLDCLFELAKEKIGADVWVLTTMGENLPFKDAIKSADIMTRTMIDEALKLAERHGRNAKP
jgi:hypothetical protein